MGIMASRSGPLRTLSFVSLIGALVLQPGIPLCAEEACPLDERAAEAVCEEPGMDCCQQSGVPVPHLPVQAPPPGPAIAAAPAADTPAPSPIRDHSALGPETAPAVIQGAGIFTPVAASPS